MLMISSFFTFLSQMALHIHRVALVADDCRRWLSQVPRLWQGVMSSDQVAIVLSCAIGDLGQVTRGLKPQLKIIGMSHIASASGYNVGLMLRTASLGLSPFWGFGRLIMSVGVIWAYVSLVGWSPSVTRAGLMTTLALSARYMGRPYSSLRSLVAVVGLMLLAQPVWIDDLGFQLSVLATLAAVINPSQPVHQNDMNSVQQISAWWVSNVGQTLKVLVLTWPIIMDLNGAWPLIALVANPIYAVLTPLIAQLGMWYLLLTAIFESWIVGPKIGLVLIWWFSLPLRFLTGLFLELTNQFVSWQVGSIGWPNWGVWHSLSWYLFWWVLFRNWQQQLVRQWKIWVFYG